MIEGQEDVSWPQWLAVAHACEQHGVPALFRSDHYMNLDLSTPSAPRSMPGDDLRAGGGHHDDRLGTMVSPATFRHPSNLAKLVMTADHISGGRVALGLGAGWHDREHEAYGFEFADTRTRMDVLEEQLQVVLGTWGDERFSFAGEHYTLTDLEAEPKPVQRPHPPLIMGGSAGPRSARMAAAYADEYNTPFATLDDIGVRRRRIDRACERAGRASIPFSVMTGVLVGSDERELRARAVRLADKMGGDPDALLREPPHGWVIGTLDQATEQLQALRDAGVARVMCQQLLHDDLDAVALLGEALAPRVI